ncbi:MAG TPA: diguanylate cyclase [Polyangiaceae bacterium]|nr:diguanylate cyclase [Polyangiaceae bacterium]
MSGTPAGPGGGEAEFDEVEPSSRSIQARLNDQRQLLARLMKLDALTRGDINAALSQVTELATSLLRVERASVWRFDSQRASIECLDLFEATAAKHSRGVVIAREQAPHYFDALTQERCIAAVNACEDLRTREFGSWYLRPLGIGSMLDAPVFLRGQMIGVVCHEHVGPPRRWEFWEELLAGTVADFVALVSEASERLRAEAQLGLYRSHVDELRRMRATEANRLTIGLRQHGDESAGEIERHVLDASPVPFVLVELSTGAVRFVNQRAAALFDASQEELVGRQARDFYVDPLERDAIVRELELGGRVENVVVRLKTLSSWPFWALLSAQRLAFEGAECAFIGLSDITAQKIAEGAVRRSEQNVRALFAAAPVAMALVRSEDSTVVFGNPRCADLFGMTQQELEGRKAVDYYVDRSERDRIVERVLEEGYVDGETVRMRRQSGQEFWALVSARAIEFDGAPALLAGVTDVSEQKALEARLRELAMHDELTGLYNRRHFVELAEAEVARARRTGMPLSLAMLDIDHFKAVNDVFGHPVGDAALRVLARCMRETLRTSDVPARLGGEEFVVLLMDTGLEGAVAVTERLRERVGRAEVPAGRERVARFTVSGGVAELAPGERLDGLLARADEALYRAKDEGRDRTATSLPPKPRSNPPSDAPVGSELEPPSRPYTSRVLFTPPYGMPAVRPGSERPLGSYSSRPGSIPPPGASARPRSEPPPGAPPARPGSDPPRTSSSARPASDPPRTSPPARPASEPPRTSSSARPASDPPRTSSARPASEPPRTSSARPASEPPKRGSEPPKR